MNKIESKDLMMYVREQGTVSVAQIQDRFQVPYPQARDAVRRLTASNVLKYKGGIEYKYACKTKAEKESDEDDDFIFGLDDIFPNVDEVRPNHVSARMSLSEYMKSKQSGLNVAPKPIAPKQPKRPALTKKQRDEMLAEIKDRFDKLTKDAQNLLQSTVIANPEAHNRTKLYFVMRRKGDGLPRDNKEYKTYDEAMAFLLKMPDYIYEDFKKFVITIA